MGLIAAPRNPSSRWLPALILALAAAGPGAAEEAGDGGSLTVELNSLQPSEGGCRLSFVAGNGLGVDIEKASFEMVLFDKAGMVERITAFDFRDLPAGRTRVRQFDLAGAGCGDISKILVNDARACAGPGLEPSACMRRLKTTNRTEAAFSD